MKKIIVFVVLIFLLVVTYIYKEDIINIYSKVFDNKHIINEIVNNKYYKSSNYLYTTNTTNFIPDNFNDLKNIYYTIINSGESKYTFYCPEEYINCLKDVKYLANEQTILSHLNNYVHPYNSFKNIETVYDNLGKVTITITKTYSEEKIYMVNNKIDEIITILNLNELELYDQIKTIHDYIINNVKYDVDRSDKNINNYDSDTAYGALIEGYALCGGYADSMALFLYNLGVDNYKISSENHIWNAVYLNNKWLHLDLTWDDPVSIDGTSRLEYNFFLINNDELTKLKTNQHTFNKDVYLEFN